MQSNAPRRSTVHVICEPLTPRHADMFFSALRDERIYRYTPDRRPKSFDELRNRFEKLSAGRSPDGCDIWLNWAVRTADDAVYVGWVQAAIHPDLSADIGYIVFPAYWGRGYATSACAWMLDELRTKHGVRRVIATVDTDNAPSIALLEKLGFRLVDTREATDMVGRLEHEFEKRL